VQVAESDYARNIAPIGTLVTSDQTSNSIFLMDVKLQFVEPHFLPFFYIV